jgi:two-component system OmpR family sensor kinase
VSLRIRLTVWFTVVLAVALITASVLVFTLVSRDLYAEVDASVESQAHDAALAVHFNGNQTFVPTRIKVPQSRFREPALYTEIRDAKLQPIWRSDTLLGTDLPASDATLDQARGGEPVFETIYQSGQRLRMYTAPIFFHDQLRGYVQVARNLSDIDVALSQLREWLLVSGLVVLIAAAGGGWILAYVALRPIDGISHAAQSIGASRRLDRRLPVPPVSDEVGRLAITFNEMLDQLEAAFMAQRRFVADASHELRTPLTTIQGNVELIRRDPAMPPAERAEALADVAEEAARMGRLVNGLLALARADAGRHLERQPVELRPIVEGAFHQAQGLARPKNVGVELVLNRLAPGARVLGDPEGLTQLLMILLENAVKYEHPNGAIRVTAATVGNAHRIVVTDHGQGIAPEDLPHIFERFYRSPRARSEDGSGLGLAIAQWLAEEHHATIAAESTPDLGSSFTVTIPALEPAPLLLVS